MTEAATGGYGSGYGKRPLWQWILLYVIIGGIIYAGVYYFYLSKKGASPYTYPGVTTEASPTATPEAMGQEDAMKASAAPVAMVELLMTKSNSTKGEYLVAANGMTLYRFDVDAKNVSNCNDSCATAWPPYMVEAGAKLPTNLTVIKRADGSSQYAYKGAPVYFYFKDAQVGDTTGDGVGGTWHLVKP